MVLALKAEGGSLYEYDMIMLRPRSDNGEKT